MRGPPKYSAETYTSCTVLKTQFCIVPHICTGTMPPDRHLDVEMLMISFLSEFFYIPPHSKPLQCKCHSVRTPHIIAHLNVFEREA
jgi:hypothetical protein